MIHTDWLFLDDPVHCQSKGSPGNFPIRGVLHDLRKLNKFNPFNVHKVVTEGVPTCSWRATVVWHLSLIRLCWTRTSPCHEMDRSGLVAWKVFEFEDELGCVRPWTLSE